MTAETKPVRASDSKRLDQDTLKSLLHYDPETGHFTWLQMAHPARVALIGKMAGHITSGGYRKINCAGVEYFAHRLAWLYMTGEWPSSEMDHANREPADNRWSNLRLATRAENTRNTRLRKSNNTGQRGVSRVGNRWIARINVDKRSIWLGGFSTFDDARDAYLKASTEYFGVWAA